MFARLAVFVCALGWAATVTAPTRRHLRRLLRRWLHHNIRSRVDGDQIDIELLDKAGKTTGNATGHYFLYEHEPGGMLLVPAPADATGPAAIRPAGLPRIDW